MAEELKTKILAAGDEVRNLKTAKAPADAVQAAVNALLALKTEYKTLTGEEYVAPGQQQKDKKPKEKPAPQPEPPKEGPSKSELKKLERKEKRKAGKGANAEGGGAGEAQAAAPAGGAKAAKAAKAPGGPAPVAPQAKKGEDGRVVFYPGANPMVTRTVLAVAHVAGLKLERGYGCKAAFLGDAPFLEMKGRVLGGEVAVLKAIANTSAPALRAGSAVVDDWLEWGHNTLAPLVHPQGDDAPSLISHVAKLESALSKPSHYLTGEAVTLADLAIAPVAKATLGFFGDHEYMHVRGWVARVLEHEAFSATQALAKTTFKDTDVEVKVNPEEGLLYTLEAVFTAALHKAFPETGGLGFKSASVSRCAVTTHGDFTCSSAMAVFKALQTSGNKNVRSPRDVALGIIEGIGKEPREILFEEVSVAGAGYVNVKIRDDFLKARIRDVLTKGCVPPMEEKKKVLVDFSSPNIAKEMHVGHLRSTIIGDTICRIFEFMGHEVLRVNHVGDWGTQFGMLIKYLKEEYPDFMTNPPNITDLTTFYKNAKKRFDDSDDFKEKARLGVVELQSGNPESRAIWGLLCDISRKEFKKVYDRLDVKLEECGESYYNSRIPGAIEKLKAKNLTVEEEGALLMWCRPKFEIPLFVRKSDGGYGYDSTDLAAILYRFQEIKCDWVIYITDAGQATHFHMIFEAARRAGWVQEPPHRVDHVGFGVVQGEDGKRFKTRSGDTVRLVDLLDEAVKRMTETLKARVAEGKGSMTEKEIDKAAAALGYGAIKYADLRQHPINDYQFSYERMLDTRGDTAIYLLFAYARLKSILRKAKEEKGIDVDTVVADGKVVLEHQAERDVAFELIQFPDVLQSIAKDLSPNKLCTYLYQLSGKATDFLEACHVLSSPERLVLVKAITVIMSTCLHLLGITPLEKI